MTVRRLVTLFALSLPLLASQGCATQALWEEFDDVTRDRVTVERPVTAERITRAARTGSGEYVLEVAYANGERRAWIWTPALPTPEPWPEAPRCEPEDEAPTSLAAFAGELPASCPEGWLPLEVTGGEDWSGAPPPNPLVDAESGAPARATLRIGQEGLLEHREGNEAWTAVARVPTLREESDEEEGVDAGDVACGIVWVGLTPVTVAVDAAVVGLVVGLVGLIVPLALL